MAAFLKYDQLVLDAFIETLNRIEKLLGLKVSYEKMMIYRVGSLQKTNAKLFTQEQLKWLDGPIALLGVHLDCVIGECEKNFNEIIVKIKDVCSKRINKRAALFGKVLIINTFMGSLFTYVTAVGCGPVIPVLTFMLTGDIHQSGYVSGRYGNLVWDGYRILFYLGRACTHLTERWQALFSRYSQSCSCWAFGLPINLVQCKKGSSEQHRSTIDPE